ncbi:MAG TPA: hypothetical protein VEO53_15625, partial [Candidatus Binatia bacterium]|nr:hypothetical protein [Candidatus Binatia bacterium]
MKTHSSPPNGQRGNTLLLTIVVTGLIGFLLATYLTLVQSQNGANVRSQSWNAAIPVVEAGIEEALAHLNTHGLTNGTLALEGWSESGGDFSIGRSVGDSFYSVTIRNYVVGSLSNSPIVESKGYVVMPLVLAASQNALLASSTSPNNTISYLGRGVRVHCRRDFIFMRGMVAKDSIDLNGNNVRTDSFDSSDPLHSTNGNYVAGMAMDNGDIAVNASLTNSLSIGNADIYGHVSTGPGGTVAIGPQGAVGDTAFHNSNQHGIETGWSKDDMNVSFPDVQPPFSGGFTPSGGYVTNVTVSVSATTNSSSSYSPFVCGGTMVTNTLTSSVYPITAPAGTVTTNYNGGSHVSGYTYSTYVCNIPLSITNSSTNVAYYDYILDDGNYQMADLHGTVYVRGNAILYVTSTLTISALVIQPGDSLKLYCAAAVASISGNNTANSAGTASSFSFWGLPTCTEVDFSGNADFTGTIYAPNAALNLNGTGNNTAIDFTGASITKSAKLNGHFNFLYDEALRK